MPVQDKSKGALQPVQPAIPGVPERAAQLIPQTQQQGSAQQKSARPRNVKSSQILIGSSVALALIVGILWWARGLDRSAAVSPLPVRASVVAANAAPAEEVPVAPGPIASVGELSRDWAAKQFVYRDASGATSSALLVRLPKSQYWAISLRAPWGSCQLQYVTDLQQLASDFGVSASHPMVVDPCSHAVFDLAKYANGPNGLVRGAIEAGQELRPPFAIEVELKGNQIFATRSE